MPLSSQELPCGHFMHSHCFTQYTRYNYTCPLCSKSVGDMAVYFQVGKPRRFSLLCWARWACCEPRQAALDVKRICYTCRLRWLAVDGRLGIDRIQLARQAALQPRAV
jgi:Ring finger domain